MSIGVHIMLENKDTYIHIISASRARHAGIRSMASFISPRALINLLTWQHISPSRFGILLRLNNWPMILRRFAWSSGQL